jgi:hypothetical protein
MGPLLKRLSLDFPALSFTEGNEFFWSARSKMITYKPSKIAPEEDLWTLLHEAGHALLNHHGYDSDVELLLLEVEAWQKAKELAQNYEITIDPDHVQDYLDTYRDWLFKRSSCPICGTQTMQKSTSIYKCFNCQAEWQVTKERFCRPYRLSLESVS